MISLLVTAFLAAEPPAPPLVDVTTVIPDVVVDLRYATDNNFMKKRVYPKNARCLLLKESAERLKSAADQLRTRGYRIKVHDCYRPSSVQYELWKVKPVPGYVMDPKVGSNHSRGGAVDLTLITLEGAAVAMPSEYDFFGKAAHHSFAGSTSQAREHRALLRTVMEAAGFQRNPMEWWHYDLPKPWRFKLRDEPFTP